MDEKELNKTSEAKEEKKVTSLSDFLAPEIEDVEEALLSMDVNACYLF